MNSASDTSPVVQVEAREAFRARARARPDRFRIPPKELEAMLPQQHTMTLTDDAVLAVMGQADFRLNALSGRGF